MLRNDDYRKLKLTARERDAMRYACRFNSQLMDHLRTFVVPGVKTIEIDKIIHDYTLEHGHRPATLGYRGYPKSCCTSINEVICHGIPDNYALREGDIINIDITSIVDGWYGDQSETFCIGKIRDDVRKVVQCSFDSLYAAIDALSPGCRVSEIGEAIEKLARKSGFSVVEEYVGHGLGREFHLEPSIPHVVTAAARRTRLEPGMCFTIEPMINLGVKRTVLDKKDGWTVRTADGKVSAQFEHTVLMTETGPEVLTYTKTGPQRGHKF